MGLGGLSTLFSLAREGKLIQEGVFLTLELTLIAWAPISHSRLLEVITRPTALCDIDLEEN